MGGGMRAKGALGRRQTRLGVRRGVGGKGRRGLVELEQKADTLTCEEGGGGRRGGAAGGDIGGGKELHRVKGALVEVEQKAGTMRWGHEREGEAGPGGAVAEGRHTWSDT